MTYAITHRQIGVATPRRVCFGLYTFEVFRKRLNAGDEFCFLVTKPNIYVRVNANTRHIRCEGEVTLDLLVAIDHYLTDLNNEAVVTHVMEI